MTDTLNRIILLLVFGPMLVLAVFAGISKLKEDYEIRKDTPQNSGNLLDWLIRISAISGASGFALMFVFLALDIPPHLPVAMMGLSIIPMIAGVVAILFDNPRK